MPSGSTRGLLSHSELCLPFLAGGPSSAAAAPASGAAAAAGRFLALAFPLAFPLALPLATFLASASSSSFSSGTCLFRQLPSGVAWPSGHQARHSSSDSSELRIHFGEYSLMPPVEASKPKTQVPLPLPEPPLSFPTPPRPHVRPSLSRDPPPSAP
eukprot:4326406-Pyramimonas_sp.AAC.1